MITTIRQRVRAWLEPAQEQDRKTRARQLAIAAGVVVTVLALAVVALYLGVLVGLFVDGFRIAT